MSRKGGSGLDHRILNDHECAAMQDYYQKQVEMLSAGSKVGRQQPGIIIHFVVAGQIANFRLLESKSTGPIDVMPVHVEDVYRQAS